MPQSRSSAAKVSDEPTTSATPETEAGQGAVMEMAKDRDSLRETLATLESATANLANAVAASGSRFEIIEEMVTNLTAAQAAAQSRMETEILHLREDLDAKTRSRRPHREEVKTQVSEQVSRFTRARRRVMHELKPGRPNRQHVKGAVVANATEYLALVGVAQVAPVALMNGIATVLFI